jgi:polyisoprenoid-binding protein YceI
MIGSRGEAVIRTSRMGAPPVGEQLPCWTFDPGRSQASFVAQRMGRTWVNGRFKDVRGKLYLDLENPAHSSCFGEIDVANLCAGEPCLNTRLRVADFLAAEEHRQITFEARLTPARSGSDFTADVLLTIRGATRPVTMEVAYLGQWQAPAWRDGQNRGTETRVGLRAEGQIARRDFGAAAENPDMGGGGAAAIAIEIALDIEAALDAGLDALEAPDA